MARATTLDARLGHVHAPASERTFALIAACCRRPLDPGAIHAAADAVDWTLFAQTVRRHRAAGLVHDAAGQVRLPLPAGVAHEIAREVRLIAMRSLAHARESVRLQKLFDAAGIPVVFLKGIALAQAAYGALTVKHARDIDILVPPAHAAAALELLLTDEYGLREPARHLAPAQVKALVTHGSQAELGRRRDRMQLELHWRLSVNRRLPHGIDPFAAVTTATVPGAGEVNVLRPDDEFVYLCVHGASHAWSRLKWLADLNARLSAYDMAQVACFYRYAEACGAGLCAGQALLLCHRVLGRDLPEGMRAALSADAGVRRLVAIAERKMRGDDPESGEGAVRTLRNVIHLFRLGRGPRFFAAQVRELLIGPGDPVRLPLPPALVFLYPLMRLPLWLWRQLPRRGKRPLQAVQRR